MSEAPITKGEFARRRGVTPGRVSQWIAEGKVTGPALVGVGRAAQILESVAVAQLRQKLDIGQRTGNGIDTRLDLPDMSAPAVVLPFQPPAPEPIEEKIKREKLEQLQRANRRLAEDDAARAGRLTDSGAVSREMVRVAVGIVNVYEGDFVAWASSLAAEFKAPQRDMLHAIRKLARATREAAAATLARQAVEMPALAEFEIAAVDVVPGEDEAE